MNTVTILRDAKQIAAAPTAQLVATYNALTGKAIKKFENRAIAERKVEMALLSAQDAAAHTGVPANTAPRPLTFAELAEAKAAKFRPGSLAEKLAAEVAQQKPIQPLPKKTVTAAATPRVVIVAVRATFAGESRCQVGSKRAAVLKKVQDSPEHTATVDALDKYFEFSTRGHLQKLLEKRHLVLVDGQS